MSNEPTTEVTVETPAHLSTTVEVDATAVDPAPDSAGEPVPTEAEPVHDDE